MVIILTIPKDQKNCSFLCRWRVPCCNKSSCAPSLIRMPPLLQVAERYYLCFIKEAASHHGTSLHSPNSSLCIFFIHSKEILFQVSKLNLHKQQGKQTRDGKKKKKIFFGDTKQQARNNKRKSLGRCSASRSQGSPLNPPINRNPSSNHTNYTRAKRK